MCIDCWQEMGSPKMLPSSAGEAIQLIERLYELDGSGGRLHIVTDDWNLEDGNIEFCREAVSKAVPGEQADVERRIVELMTPMSAAERGATLARFQKWS